MKHRRNSGVQLALGIFVILFTGTVTAVLLRPVLQETFVTSESQAYPSTSSGSTTDQAISLTVSPGTTPPPAPTASANAPVAPTSARSPASPEVDKVTTMENQITDLINKERTELGCKAVKNDSRLQKAARAHSTDMAKNNYFSHTGRNGSDFVNRVAAQGYPKNAATGENIAYGYPTAQAVVNGWMNSTDHRNNIMNCDSKATGVGLAYRGSTPYWTQLFGSV